MKANKVKTLLQGSTLFTAVILMIFVACNQQRPEDTKDTAEDRNDAKFDENKNEKDAKFLVDAAEIDLMEIQLGQLASTKATAADVKDLGKMMEEQHSKSLDNLKALAAKKTVSLPTSITDDGQDHYKKLADKNGNDFDKEFCDMMVDGHKDAISKFEKASTESNDAEIKDWAAATLPTLRNHLDHALTCQEKVKNNK
jgi:putative membrane protein